MEQEEISDPTIEVGDRVWWQREDVRGWSPEPIKIREHLPGHMQVLHPYQYEGSVLTGKVRKIQVEDDFSYATIACDPDARILLVATDRLVKGVPPDPIPVIDDQESPKEEVQPPNADGAAPTVGDDTVVDLDVWGEALAP